MSKIRLISFLGRFWILVCSLSLFSLYICRSSYYPHFISCVTNINEPIRLFMKHCPSDGDAYLSFSIFSWKKKLHSSYTLEIILTWYSLRDLTFEFDGIIQFLIQYRFSMLWENFLVNFLRWNLESWSQKFCKRHLTEDFVLFDIHTNHTK